MTHRHTVQPLAIAVLISGNGSNLQAIIDAIAMGLPARINVVISNHANAYGLQRAQSAGIATEVLERHNFTNRYDYDRALQRCLERYQPEWIILAGFMHILDAELVTRFTNRILNIHPSLLPKHPGLNTHTAVLHAGDTMHGATVHLVTAELDSGTIIAQARLTVSADDNADSLKTKVHHLEHQLYPLIIKLIAEQRLQVCAHSVTLDGQPLPANGLQFEHKV